MFVSRKEKQPSPEYEATRGPQSQDNVPSQALEIPQLGEATSSRVQWSVLGRESPATTTTTTTRTRTRTRTRRKRNMSIAIRRSQSSGSHSWSRLQEEKQKHHRPLEPSRPASGSFPWRRKRRIPQHKRSLVPGQLAGVVIPRNYWRVFKCERTSW